MKSGSLSLSNRQRKGSEDHAPKEMFHESEDSPDQMKQII